MSKIPSLLLLAALGAPAVQAAPVAAALDRPALMARDPAHAVLLCAARSGDRVVAVGERGIILSSDDAGFTWRQSPSPVAVTLAAVRFADARTVYAVGHGGVVLASTDAGQRWERRFDGRQAAELALQAAQAGGDERAVADAQRLVQDGPDKPFLDLHFLDARRGVVVGAYGLAFATEDGGRTWQPLMARLPNPKGLHLYALRVQGDTWVIAGEQGLALRSTDGGRSFSALQTPYRGSFFTAELPSAQAIVLAGLRGNAWRSNDGGATWAQLEAPAPVSFTSSALTAGGEVLLANQAGGLFKATENRLSPLNAAPLPPVNGVLPLEANALLAVGLQGATKLKIGTRP